MARVRISGGLMALAMALVVALGGVQSAWAAQGLEAGGIDAQGVQVSTQDYEDLDADGKIYIRDRTAGTATYNASTKTITLTGVSANSLWINPEGQSFTLVLNGANKLEVVYSNSSLTVKGAGSISVSDSFNVFDNVLNMTQGTIDGAVYAGSLNMKGGTIKGAGDLAIVSARNGLTMTGGSIVLSSSTHNAINISNGDFTMSGGSISVTNAKYGAISVSKYASSSSTNTGKATITGGTLTLTTADPKTCWAIDAGMISNKLGCIKTISGRLSQGAQFTVGKNLYKVMKSSPYVTLVKYNAKSKKPKVNKAKYGGYAYEVGGIGAGAFNTAAGKKVTSITINSNISQIGKNAFANTKALKTLMFKYTAWIKRVESGSRLKSLKVSSGCTVAKKAFAKAGKGGGKQLTVKLSKYGVSNNEVAKYKKFLKSKGLPGKAKLKTWW